MTRNADCTKRLRRSQEVEKEKSRAAYPRWRRWIFPLAGGLSLLWWLIRVLPKPARANYPCMRAAFPAAAAFVIWLSSAAGAWFTFRKVRRNLLQGSYGRAGVFFILALAALGLWSLNPFSLPNAAQAYVPSEGRNNPMGVGKGIFPGRVVWVRDPAATPWDGVHGYWWEDGSVDQSKVDNMFSISLRRLTGAVTDEAAWTAIFQYHNERHGRGRRGYQAEEKIALKINCNNAYGGYGDVDNEIDASPQAVLSMLRQLVNKARVPPNQITIYEASRVLPNRIYNKSHAEFPEVIWVDSQGTGENGRQPVVWVTNRMAFSSPQFEGGKNLPTCVVEATYLINLALLKGHGFAGVSLTAKNHLGTISNPERFHTIIDPRICPPGNYHPFVDIIGSGQLGDKTILYMIDGLYGVRNVIDTPAEFGHWNNLFGGQWSSSIFASFDPVAIDSVAVDFLTSEFGDILGSGNSKKVDNYLHEAALADNPPSGTFYQTNGVRLSSLGVHEHWNNAQEKKYSRNLRTGNGIELLAVQPLITPVLLVPAQAEWKYLDDGSEPDPAWRTVNFDDSRWAQGRAELGYGNNPNTVVSFGPDSQNKYITTYFRKTFLVDDPAILTKLVLGLQRNDGAVVYLNGEEIRRSNMPKIPITRQTLALKQVGGDDTTAFFQSVVTNRLRPGSNLLAVEIHKAAANGPDLRFDLTLTANSTLAPMPLNAKILDSRLLLSWPDTPWEYALEVGSGTPATNWTIVSNIPTFFTNGEVILRLKMSVSNHFFRLKRAN